MQRQAAAKCLGVLLLTLVLAGCGRRYPSSAAPSRLVPRFSAIRDQILIPNCTSCHRSFETYAGVRPYVTTSRRKGGDSNELIEVIRENEMPPLGPPLTNAELQTIEDWIALGALND